MNEFDIASIEFTIPGEPVIKGRPKFRMFHGFVSTYTPKATAKAEKAIAEEFKRLFGDNKLPMNKPVKLTLEFRMPIPTSLSKKKRLALNGQLHTKRPDIDNLTKLVQDALNGLAWDDDSLVCLLEARKCYSFTPCTVIKIEYLTNLEN